MKDIWRKISTVLDRKNNKFAFWAEASLWSTLVSCQLCENDLEPKKLSIISQQDSGSLTVNVQLFLTEPSISSPSKCSTSVAGSFLRQGLNQILSGFPSPFCIANFFFLLWKIFLISPEHLYLYWHLAPTLNTKHRGLLYLSLGFWHWWKVVMAVVMLAINGL